MDVAQSSTSQKQQQLQSQSTQVKCPDFPDCKLSEEECGRVHPKELCKYFPNCAFGRDCLFLHPAVPCRFQDRCQNPYCNYTHDGAGKTAEQAAIPATVFAPSSILCRFNGRCQRPDCPFLHTVNAPCPHGAACQRPACPFQHPPDHLLPARSRVNRPCRFGRSCAKADCPYLHPERDAVSTTSSGVATPTIPPGDVCQVKEN